MVLSGQIQTIRGKERFIPHKKGDSFNRLEDAKKQFLVTNVHSLTKKNYRLAGKDGKSDVEQSISDSIEHDIEPDNGEQQGFKLLDVGPIHHIDEPTLKEINGLSQGRNTDGVFFQPNLSLSTQQSPPPTHVQPNRKEYWGQNQDQAKIKQGNVKRNRNRLKPLYLQAKQFFQELKENPTMKTYQDERNLDLLLAANHPEKNEEVRINVLFNYRY